MATSKYNLALLRRQRNVTDIARQLFREREQIYITVYGPDHSKQIYASVYGPDHRSTLACTHLDVAVSYMGLGNVYESLGKYEEALEMHSKSLDIKTRILGGDNHPCSWIHSEHRDCIVYGKKGDRTAATEMYTKAYHIFLKKLGPDHPQTQGLKPFVDE